MWLTEQYTKHITALKLHDIVWQIIYKKQQPVLTTDQGGSLTSMTELMATFWIRQGPNYGWWLVVWAIWICGFQFRFEHYCTRNSEDLLFILINPIMVEIKLLYNNWPPLSTQLNDFSDHHTWLPRKGMDSWRYWCWSSSCGRGVSLSGDPPAGAGSSLTEEHLRGQRRGCWVIVGGNMFVTPTRHWSAWYRNHGPSFLQTGIWQYLCSRDVRPSYEYLFSIDPGTEHVFISYYVYLYHQNLYSCWQNCN